MNLNILKPRKALNKAFLKVKPNRNEIEYFKENLIRLFDHINETESEEFHKNIVSAFLKNTYYKENHYINTKGRNDLVIHNGKDAKSTVGVIIEAKKPTNKAEMLKIDNINTKAFQELVLYYLRERITGKNLDVKYLIATNIYEWFIFDAQLFERLFAHNKALVNQFNDFEENRLSVHKTDSFYKEIAEPYINDIKAEITFTHFDIRHFDNIIRNSDKKDDSKLIALYKLLSPEHLLKLPFVNDSNSLDKRFYSELLHIIGLTETKEGSKKLIERKKEGERNSGSLIENSIIQLDSLDKISRLEKPYRFGETNKERLFNVALELSITWVNRILFLKLLEAQLISYHKGDKSFSFLNIERVKNYDDLNGLFFQVLARIPEERNDEIKKAFAKVPYLNSSLFEPTQIEHSCLFISQLSDKKIPILGSTVLKDVSGKKRTGEIDSLEYFFEFLDAYDFTSEGKEEIQEDNKTLINASVLGLIFEKINGYKDGSFFTPSFITMYMCRETIRRAVVQKFNEVKGWDCNDLKELYDKIEDKKEANQIINSIKICDPAVGSGHFLVSALNEIIVVKSELKILLDRQDKRLKEYHVEVENDELIITDEDGEFLEYNPRNPESQRVQETLFHEKQTIIESCLFGVDINPNSVKICRLRLWIELLKNAYYKESGEFETLPNIDINIKCGNSLISRYALDADIKAALKRSKWSIDSYRLAVMTYRNAQSKDEKRAMERLIEQIKNDFESEVAANDKRKIRLNKLKGELLTLTTQTTLYDRTKAEKTTWEKQVNRLNADIKAIEIELEEIKNNKIYENAFEWRFEFPEVLNDEGGFEGFDVVIGNPPYGITFNKMEKTFFVERYTTIDDIYTVFIEKGKEISKNNGNISLIIPIFWLTNDKYISTRRMIANHLHLIKGITLPYDIFSDAFIDTGIFLFSKGLKSQASYVFEFEPKDKIDFNILTDLNFINLELDEWKYSNDLKIVFNPLSRSLLNKLNKFETRISDITDSIRGILANLEDYSETKLSNEYKPIFTGKLDRYYIDNDIQYVRYGENLKEKPSSIHFFSGERLLVRRIINRQFRIMASIATNDFVTKKDIYIFKIKGTEVSLKVLLAIINSKLISFIKTKASTTAKKDDFTQLTLNDIRDLAVPIPNQQQKILIEKLVSEILTNKQENPLRDYTILESNIDKLIYQLYGLTEEEIKIIENDAS